MKDDDLLIRFLQLKKVFLLLLISINELDLPGKEITKRRRILVYNLVIVEVSEVYQSFQFCSFFELKGGLECLTKRVKVVQLQLGPVLTVV